ncbi:phosphoribosylanthranilate isomerase [uncultured Abyssibacter sp.]|uniref:phosphoribosylanthranilate isomerase n=1 Tax=uncultured Abyssibacter sp. TaxID=2320202 RepID=UPI0032B2D609
MRRTRIKICGLTRPDDVDEVVRAGVDAIGLVFAPGSPRRVDTDLAVALRRRVPALCTCVALVMDQAASEIEQIVRAVRPDMLQFHGAETAEECGQFGLPYIKAMGLGGRQPVDLGSHPDALVLTDSHAPGGAGGTGRTFDWTRVADWARRRPLMLAGGLNADNVEQAIRVVRPWAVDVSSGVEEGPGLKSANRMQAFMRAVQRADQSDD